MVGRTPTSDLDLTPLWERGARTSRSGSVPPTLMAEGPHPARVDALLARLRDAQGSILWLLHVNADPDCVGSAYALREAFGGTVAASDGMNRPGERVAQRLAMGVEAIAHPQNFHTVVAVDTGSRSGLGALGATVGDPFLVDHHRYGDLHERAPAAAWDPARASCAEVVLALLDHAGHAPSKKAALALVAGVVSDTGRFRHGDAHALAAAARLMEMSGARMEEVLALLADEDADADDTDARLATLKAAQRAEVTQVRGFLVATSRIGSYDALAANALVRAGADVAVVGLERGDAARMSLRASPRARGLHLGELANAVARPLGWSGGGHEGAAGLRGTPPLDAAQRAMLDALRARLEAL